MEADESEMDCVLTIEPVFDRARDPVNDFDGDWNLDPERHYRYRPVPAMGLRPSADEVWV
jgi:hypothetical protein